MDSYTTRIGLSSASYFDRLPLEDIIDDFTRHEVGLCELFLNTRSEYGPEFRSVLTERLAAPGAPKVHSVHPLGTQFEPQLFSRHPRQQKDAMDTYVAVLKTARAIGAGVYVMHGPIMLEHAAFRPETKRFIPVIRDLCSIAKDFRIRLALENVSWCLFRSPDVGKELTDALGDSLHYTLDIKQAIRSGFDYRDFIDVVGPLLTDVHLCDHVKTDDGFRWKVPGQGETDFRRLFCELHSAGYQGPAFIEVYSNSYGQIDELYDSVAYLNREAAVTE